MFIDRRLFRNFDWPLLGVTLAVVLVGLPVMYSASFGREGSSEVFTEHLMRLAIGFLCLLVALLLDYHLITRYAFVLYGLNVLVLIYTSVSGVIGLGARRWLSIGPAALQPSEMFKITLILTLAGFLTRPRQGVEVSPADLGAVCLLIGLPLALILEQPDLGTAGIVMLIFVTMLLVNGLSRKSWLLILKAGMGVGLAGFLIYSSGLLRPEQFLKPYQYKRIMVLFRPELDPLGAGYHIAQSKIAVGSGGILGKGFLNGTQNQLRFLPQQHTDFIFSVLAEEWGFLGVLFVISLYVSLFLLCLQAARSAKDRLGGLIALGVTAMIFYHTVINIGMTIGYMPVVGIPLPFMSYGGSSFMVVMVGIGLLLNVRMRRFII